MIEIKELVLVSIAAGFGFTVATGINITYLNTISHQASEQVEPAEINKIERFWTTYNSLNQVETFIEEKEDASNLCVIVSDKKICVLKSANLTE